MQIIKCVDCGFGYVGAAGESACPKCAVAIEKGAVLAPTNIPATNTSPAGDSTPEIKPHARSSRRVVQEPQTEELDSIIRRLDRRTAEIEQRLARLNKAIYEKQPSLSHLAVASLVAAFLFPLAAIILGHAAQRELRESKGYKYGDGLATTGLILGYLGLLGVVIWTIVSVNAVSQGY